MIDCIDPHRVCGVLVEVAGMISVRNEQTHRVPIRITKSEKPSIYLIQCTKFSRCFHFCLVSFCHNCLAPAPALVA